MLRLTGDWLFLLLLTGDKITWREESWWDYRATHGSRWIWLLHCWLVWTRLHRMGNSFQFFFESLKKSDFTIHIQLSHPWHRTKTKHAVKHFSSIRRISNVIYTSNANDLSILMSFTDRKRLSHAHYCRVAQLHPTALLSSVPEKKNYANVIALINYTINSPNNTA